MKLITIWLHARLPDSPTPGLCSLCSLTPVAAKAITESTEPKESQTLGRNGLDGEGAGKVQEAQEARDEQSPWWHYVNKGFVPHAMVQVHSDLRDEKVTYWSVSRSPVLAVKRASVVRQVLWGVDR